MFRATLLLAASAAGVAAQSAVNITSTSTPNVVYGFNAGSIPTVNTTSGGSANLRVSGLAGQDQLFANWWYYRVNADTREFSFSQSATSGIVNPATPIQVNPTGDTAEIAWVNVDGKGFNARLTTTVYSTTNPVNPNSGVASQCLEITNNSGAPLVLNLFNYADFDACGSAGTDTATLVGPQPQIEVRDAACAARCYHMACRNNNFLTAPFGAASAQSLMINTVVDNLPNTGLPFASADWTNGYQWQDVTIPNNQSARFYIALAGDRQLQCCNPADLQPYCNGKPGTNGIPFWGRDKLFVGGQTELKVISTLAGATPIALLGAAPGVCIPIPGIGSLAVNPIILTFVMPAAFGANNTSAQSLGLPPDASLCGAQVTLQAFILDPGAVGSIAHTAGSQHTIGSL